jgi:hypothetical protein
MLIAELRVMAPRVDVQHGFKREPRGGAEQMVRGTLRSAAQAT